MQSRVSCVCSDRWIPEVTHGVSLILAEAFMKAKDPGFQLSTERLVRCLGSSSSARDHHQGDLSSEGHASCPATGSPTCTASAWGPHAPLIYPASNVPLTPLVSRPTSASNQILEQAPSERLSVSDNITTLRPSYSVSAQIPTVQGRIHPDYTLLDARSAGSSCGNHIHPSQPESPSQPKDLREIRFHSMVTETHRDNGAMAEGIHNQVQERRDSTIPGDFDGLTGANSISHSSISTQPPPYER